MSRAPVCWGVVKDEEERACTAFGGSGFSFGGYHDQVSKRVHNVIYKFFFFFF